MVIKKQNALKLMRAFLLLLSFMFFYSKTIFLVTSPKFEVAFTM